MSDPTMTAELLEAWLQCERRAWLERHRPELKAEQSGLEAYLSEQRRDLWRVYRGRLERIAGGAPVEGGGADLAPLLAAGPGAVVDARLRSAALGPTGVPGAARLDGVRRTRAGWVLETLAVGTRVRPHHVRRLAFAHALAEAEDVPLTRCAVVHVARPREARAGRLLAHDVTAACRQAQRRLPARLAAASASLHAAREPRTAIGPHCRQRRPCPFLEHCWAATGDHSIYHLPELGAPTRAALRSAGWLDARALPPRPPGLSPAERRALEDARDGRVRVDTAALREALAALTAPVAYLDVEFATPAVPWLPDMRPFEPLPFQFSLHLEDARGRVRRVEHLHRRPDGDPRPALAAALAPLLEGAGQVVVYDAAAEASLLAQLAEADPPRAGALHAAAERVWDLLAVMRATVRHPGFGTRWGLKRVASTLAPGSYRGVRLVDGLDAQAAWRRFLRTGDPELDAALRRYCRADSRALLRVVRVLRHWARAGAPPPNGA